MCHRSFISPTLFLLAFSGQLGAQEKGNIREPHPAAISNAYDSWVLGLGMSKAFVGHHK